MRLQYPPDIKLILMPCTGRVDIIHLLKAFEAGADSVMVVGCLGERTKSPTRWENSARPSRGRALNPAVRIKPRSREPGGSAENLPRPVTGGCSTAAPCRRLSSRR